MKNKCQTCQESAIKLIIIKSNIFFFCLKCAKKIEEVFNETEPLTINASICVNTSIYNTWEITES